MSWDRPFDKTQDKYSHGTYVLWEMCPKCRKHRGKDLIKTLAFLNGKYGMIAQIDSGYISDFDIREDYYQGLKYLLRFDIWYEDDYVHIWSCSECFQKPMFKDIMPGSVDPNYVSRILGNEYYEELNFDDISSD